MEKCGKPTKHQNPKNPGAKNARRKPPRFNFYITKHQLENERAINNKIYPNPKNPEAKNTTRKPSKLHLYILDIN